jgi:1-acyl-sn-glycerol-3-phosphate acyltransferase
MGLLRLYLRLTLIFCMTCVLASIRLMVWPIACYSEPLDRRIRRSLIRYWNLGFAKIAGIKLVIHGTPPKPPFYLVSNHLSYMDMLVLCSQTGSIFVSREDVEHWPVLGFLARSLYIIFIDRQKRSDTVRVNKLIAHTLASGDGLVVFPESRIFRGLEVEPFKSALIQPAVDNGLPVHYATLHYETPEGSPPASEIVGWWRPEPFFAHLFRLLRFPGFKATVHFGETPIPGTDRKILAEQLHAAVSGNFVPIR